MPRDVAKPKSDKPVAQATKSVELTMLQAAALVALDGNIGGVPQVGHPRYEAQEALKAISRAFGLGSYGDVADTFRWQASGDVRLNLREERRKRNQGRRSTDR